MNTNNTYFKNFKYILPPNYQHLSQNTYNNPKNLIFNKKYNNYNYEYSKTTRNIYYNCYPSTINSNQTVNLYYNPYNNLNNNSVNELSFIAMKSSLKSRYLQQNYNNNIFGKEFNHQLALSNRRKKYFNLQNTKLLDSTNETNCSLQHNLYNQSNIKQIPVTHYSTKNLKNFVNKNQIESKSLQVSFEHENASTNDINKMCSNDLLINKELHDTSITTDSNNKKNFNQSENLIEDEQQTKPIIYPVLPNEILWEVVQFLSFNDCAKIAIVSRVFTSLTEPRTKLKLKLVKNFFTFYNFIFLLFLAN